MPDVKSSIISLVSGEIYTIVPRTPAIMQVHKLIALKEDTPRQLAIYFPHRGNMFASRRPFPETNPFFSLSARPDSSRCCILRFSAARSRRVKSPRKITIAYHGRRKSYMYNVTKKRVPHDKLIIL